MIIIKKPYNALTDDDKIKIIKYYYKYRELTFDEIADKLNVSGRSVPRVLQENGINTKLKNRYVINNEDYFEKINTEFKAYMLGFIYADGFVGTHNDFCISLTDKNDEGINLLSKFKEELGTNLEIRHEISKEGHGKYTFKFSNKKIVGDLNKHGVFTKKSLDIENIPVLDDEMYSHFIRGYFDGDGTICTYFDNYDKKQRIVFGMLGTEKFLNQIEDILCKQCNIKKTKLKKVRDIRNLYSISRKGVSSIIKIRDYLYNNANFYFKYKHDRFYNIQPL